MNVTCFALPSATRARNGGRSRDRCLSVREVQDFRARSRNFTNFALLGEFGVFGANGAFLMHFEEFGAFSTLWPQKVPSG